MSQGKILIIVFIALLVGLTGGFVLRPIIIPPANTGAAAVLVPAPAAPAVARGTQYFAANLDDARRIVAGCRDGSVRGEECANAQQAVVEAEGRDRFNKFMGH